MKIRYHVVRTTTEKLEERIAEGISTAPDDGDDWKITLDHVYFTGGRDWVLLFCASTPDGPAPADLTYNDLIMREAHAHQSGNWDVTYGSHVETSDTAYVPPLPPEVEDTLKRWAANRDNILPGDAKMLLDKYGRKSAADNDLEENIAAARRWIAKSDDDGDNGWVADQDRRHARFDEAARTRPDLSDSVMRSEHTDPSGFTTLIDAEVEWGDIRYGRYDEHRVPTGNRFVGWVEDHARSWIIFLGPHGAPALYWPRRDASGGVIGKPVDLRQ